MNFAFGLSTAADCSREAVVRGQVRESSPEHEGSNAKSAEASSSKARDFAVSSSLPAVSCRCPVARKICPAFAMTSCGLFSYAAWGRSLQNAV